MSHKLFGSLIIMLVITACAPATPAPAPSATPVPLDEKVDVGGYSLRILCSGEGTPTVIVEAALADPATDGSTWSDVISGIEKTTRICVYDRAGLGSSDPAPNKPRTSQDMVNDLHTLLVNANVPGPYVLVGHNVGGFNVRLYANQYPDEVVGMVLVDAIHPDYEPETLAVLPPKTPDEPVMLERIRKNGLYPSADNPMNGEGIDLTASADQVRGADPRGDLTLVILTSGFSWLSFPDLSPDVSSKMDQVWQDLQVDLVSLSSNSSHVLSTKPYSSIPITEPELMIYAILKVLNEAKK